MKRDKTKPQEVNLTLGFIEFNKHDTQKGVFTFTDNGKPIGEMTLYWETKENIFFKLSAVQNNTFEKEYWSKMIYLSMCYVFEELNIRKLSCELICDASKVIDSYLSQGFEREGIFKQNQLIDSKYYDVYRLSCFKSNFIKYLKNYNLNVLNGERYPINIGDKYIEDTIISDEDIVKYSDVSGDKNPLHLDSKFAIKNGYNTNIVHGMLSASIFSKILGTKFPGNGSIYISQELKFLQPIYPNERVTIKLKILSIIGSKFIIKTNIIKKNRIVLEGIAKIIKS